MRLDAAYNVSRHITEPGCAHFLEELQAALQPLGDYAPASPRPDGQQWDPEALRDERVLRQHRRTGACDGAAGPFGDGLRGTGPHCSKVADAQVLNQRAEELAGMPCDFVDAPLVRRDTIRHVRFDVGESGGRKDERLEDPRHVKEEGIGMGDVMQAVREASAVVQGKLATMGNMHDKFNEWLRRLETHLQILEAQLRASERASARRCEDIEAHFGDELAMMRARQDEVERALTGTFGDLGPHGEPGVDEPVGHAADSGGNTAPASQPTFAHLGDADLCAVMHASKALWRSFGWAFNPPPDDPAQDAAPDDGDSSHPDSGGESEPVWSERARYGTIGYGSGLDPARWRE